MVAGSGKQWFSGSLGQASGTNCSILGGSYSETMVSAISGYGGAPGGGVVRVNDAYWATILISVPGNQCPHGSDIVTTDVVMPPGTSYDSSRPIRCFSTPRLSSNWYENTNEGWDMRPIGVDAYGPTCPSGPTPSFSGNGTGFGYRALASGQMFMMFIPVKSTQPLLGAGASPAHEFRWIVTPMAAYGSAQTHVWTNVFNAGPSTPYVYFSRDPSAVPFWKTNPTPPGTENRVELFANLYTAGYSGTFCFYVYHGTHLSPGAEIWNCNSGGPGTWNASVPADPNGFFELVATGDALGPNGGYVPFAFDPPEYGLPFTVKWEFTYNGTQKASAWVDFQSLSGPDEDGDGVANDGKDQCPGVAGTLPNGCQPSISALDPDGDGLVGEKDVCPSLAKISAPNGCPTLNAAFGKLPRLQRKKAGKGVTLPVTCSLDSTVTAVATVSKSVAKKLKLKVKKGATTLEIGKASGICSATTGGKLKIKISAKPRKAIVKAKKPVIANVNLTFSTSGGVAPTNVAATIKFK